MLRKKDKLPSPPINMLEGPFIPQLLRFSVPLMLAGVLQLLYNAADLIVVGRFSSDPNALAAVGACTSLIHLLVNVFMGLAVGANVVIARSLGAQDNQRASSASHTALTISVMIGVGLSVITLFFTEQLLLWMGTPAEVLPGACLYLRIFACGFPVSLLYNFGAAVLRACGDTRRPMYFLMFSGLINVLLNLLFVCVFGMAANGVALATVLSQVVSALLVVFTLLHMHSPCRLFFGRLGVCAKDLLDIMRIGVPAGIQSACFGLSNVIIQSSINSFGAIAIAGSTAASNIEGIVYTCFDAVSQSCLTFGGQNMGAGKIRRIPRLAGAATVLGTALWAITTVLSLAFAGPLLSLYTSNAQAIAYGTERMWIVAGFYFICAWMGILSNTLRSMGVSVLPMITCIIGVCGVRLVWIWTIFESMRTLPVLYISYPVTWGITTLVLGIMLVFVYRKRTKAPR